MAGNLAYDVFVTLEGHDLVIVEVGESDAADSAVLHVPDHLGRMILRVSASVLYGVREHPAADSRQIILASWL